MTSRITEFDRPHRFVDEQVRGPFARFRHVHRFEPEGEGTMVIDEVEFDAPFGSLGQARRALDPRPLPRRLDRAAESAGMLELGHGVTD
jgi:ligand-binding SRPBCC domain-containing protein